MAHKKYQIIYADPPWQYGSKSILNGKSDKSGELIEDCQYTTTSTKELCKIDVKSISHKDCAMFMWVTDSHLPDALELIKAWGFTFKTIAFKWVKTTKSGETRKNVGPWTMKSCEVCLLATRGSMLKYKKVNNLSEMIFSDRSKHSKKPDEAREKIERLFGDLPRLEMFARQKTEGWDVFGNEVDDSIEIPMK